MIHFSEKNWNLDLINLFFKCGLPQITILRTNSKIVGTHTFRKKFLLLRAI
ncbi:hypothetical protein LEP1GSC173_1607 [Leptospira interrogans str. HAI1594]|uniref:Uncharacterized protein n=1 Tax=Leptospira interrogans serovar Hardjo str. Norma TaxID=1279460 RepID=A0A0M3TLQ4_LEPIR|nr:hypothetical protein G436_2312 [Leptospira interrogans serovar Hardjo str. Norma]ALO00609.1 hypothetical protein LIH_09605 [Leptospira interrogans serovar Hardjo-prajitno]EKP76018.1 hypothetical protein LEP1GSC173_1607 [Leptospira interrogans str. HAI1594]